MLGQKRSQHAGKKKRTGRHQLCRSDPGWFSRIKLLRIATETRNSRTFSPAKETRYTVLCMHNIMCMHARCAHVHDHRSGDIYLILLTTAVYSPEVQATKAGPGNKASIMQHHDNRCCGLCAISEQSTILSWHWHSMHYATSSNM